jgi:hypothetical protein
MVLKLEFQRRPDMLFQKRDTREHFLILSVSLQIKNIVLILIAFDCTVTGPKDTVAEDVFEVTFKDYEKLFKFIYPKSKL